MFRFAAVCTVLLTAPASAQMVEDWRAADRARLYEKALQRAAEF